MKLLICGGRDFTDIEYGVICIQLFHNQLPVTRVICGMQRGGDMIGHNWATFHGIPIDEYHADWQSHGKAAGPIRNQRMLDEGLPDVVLGLPGGIGTAHMLSIAHAAGIPIVEYSWDDYYKDRQMDDAEMALHGIVASAYRLKSNPDVRIEWRGDDRWAVLRSAACLNNENEWEYEPMTSWRDEEFIARCRFPLDEALRRALAI